MSREVWLNLSCLSRIFSSRVAKKIFAAAAPHSICGNDKITSASLQIPMAKLKTIKKPPTNQPINNQPETDAPKSLGEYEQSTPGQLELFSFLQPQEKNYSNTIELYDFMPKYHWGKVKRVNGKFLDSLERQFECRGKRYRVNIQPASLTDKNGAEKYYYPSKREELVEDALRRLVTAGQGLFLDEVAGVTFTLYQLQQELKRNGHSYSTNELKEALLICAKTNITVTSEDGSAVLVSSLFETLGLQSREDWKDKGERSKAFVRFNSLVTESIKRGTFRQLNYEKAMSYRSVIARQLHKRMSHHYTQASIAHPYHILLSTIIRDFGLAQYDTPKHNLRNVKKAIDEMKTLDILLNYKIEPTHDTANRNKFIDAKFILVPHPTFVGEVMQANKRQGNISQFIAEDIKV